jgi:GPH family glycoside/pentoside/hexuronide:cation symporter
MNEATHPTAPQDRVPVFQKMVYGLGALTNNLLSGAMGCMSIVLNLGLGMNPGTVGMIMACSRLTDAFLDPIMGYVSDHTHSRWGRRRPYLVVGAVLTGFVFAFMWQIPSGHSQRFYFWFFLLGTNLFYAAFTLYGAPFIGLGYEMTPDYYERIRIQGYSNLIGQIPWLVLSWFYAFMENKRFFATNVEGARALAIIVGVVVIVVGVLPGIFCKEPLYAIARAQHKKDEAKSDEFVKGLFHHVTEFFKGFAITLKNRHFLKLAAATFLVFNGFTLISGLGSYVIIFYVMGGDQVVGAKYIGIFGTTLSLCTFGAISVVTWMATKVGKKKAFIISTSIAITGYVMKWFCYKPGMPNLIFFPTPLIAFGLGGLFTTISAMIADVCDQDELDNGYRREGTFGAIYWWMVKLGMAVALAIAGHLLNLTGFLQELGPNQSARSLFLMRVFEVGLPILTYGLAILAVASYDLDQDKVQAIRLELEKRRGKATVEV